MTGTAHRFIDRRGTGRGVSRPVAYTTELYATPSNTWQSNQYRSRPNVLNDFHKSLTRGVWQSLLAYSRQLYAQLGTLGAAVHQKNLYAVGSAWQPQFMGRNTAWGERAEEWLTNVWYPVADVRGGAFDFVTDLFLDGVAMDVDGDAAMLLTRSESGFPLVQFLPAHRIGNREYDVDATVRGGDYDGATIRNGCILNRDGRVIAYRILGDTAEQDVDVSTRDCQLGFEPEWQGQLRGVPRIARSLLDWFDTQDIDTFLKRGVKLDASVGLLHYNEEGGPPTALDIINDSSSTAALKDLKIERREGGEIFYFKAGKGEKLESLSSDRPHPNTESFIARLERRGLLSVGWFYELLDPSKVGGASVRLIQDQARHSIRNRQRSRLARAKRAVIYALARAMKGGFLPANNEAGMDWMQWDFTRPAALTVDEGYSRAADIDDLERGLTTEADVCGKGGRWWEDVRSQRLRERKALLTDARELADEFDIDMTTAIDLLCKRSANPPPVLSKDAEEAQFNPPQPQDNGGNP